MDKDKERDVVVWGPKLMDLIDEFTDKSKLNNAEILGFYVTQISIMLGALITDDKMLDDLLGKLRSMTISAREAYATQT